MKKTDLQRFEMATIKRSQIKEHPQNPRVISDSAKKKLKAKIKEVGLLQPLIVNRRTMYLLGGHQRLASLDSLERYTDGKNDYELDVAMVDLDHKPELEMLVFLNNPSAQGGWDTEILAEINIEQGIDFTSMGFDGLDVDLLFQGDHRFADLLPDAPEVVETKDGLREIKESRKQAKEKMDEDQKIDYFFVVVCKDKAEKERLLKQLKLPAHEKYVSGSIVDAAFA